MSIFKKPEEIDEYTRLRMEEIKQKRDAYSQQALQNQASQYAQMMNTNTMASTISSGGYYTPTTTAGGTGLGLGNTLVYPSDLYAQTRKIPTKISDIDLFPLRVPPVQPDLYKVLMHRNSHGEFTVWLGPGYVTRSYTIENMPDEAKSKLTMILAHKSERADRELSLAEVESTAFISTYPPEFDDTGWRVSSDFLCVVLSGECLENFRGKKK